jgi:light-regulated signal transduction histidine kinase (bacteriophytochrome)
MLTQLTNSASHLATSIQLGPSGLLHRLTHRIRRSLDFQEILNATAAEVQQYLGCDRVKIYKFHPDGSGQVIAEYLAPQQPLPSLFGLNFPADDIPPHARQLFIEARVRNIVNVETGLIGQSRLCDPETGEPLAADWAFRPLDPCHREYLTTMGVKAGISAPIFHHDQLWGLLVAHHAQPHELTLDQLQGVQIVVDQLSVAIAQAAHFQMIQAKAEHKTILNRIASQLNCLEQLDLQTALEVAVTAFKGSGGRLLWQSSALAAAGSEPSGLQPRSHLYTCGSQPLQSHLADPLLENCYGIQAQFSLTADRLWAIDDIYQVSNLRTVQSAFRATAIRSWLIIPLTIQQQQCGYLSIFRDQVDTETLWAGYHHPDQRQHLPRQSFEIWRQSQIGQAKPWQPQEIDLATAIIQQFTRAIEQYDLYQQVHILNSSLETQVKERTAALHQATQQQQILFEVVTKMRQSLDLEQIFATVTQEVQRSLNADRVIIYQFDPNSAFNLGHVIAEAVQPPFPLALGAAVEDHCFGERYAQYYRQGHIFTMPDIQQAGLQECFQAVLEQFQIKATLVAPVLKGDQLWGLFCVHQCAQPRHWQTAETEFVQQVAAQLSIALEQADLLAQRQQQTQKLTATLQDLQSTQAQLIQTEKMSSLGQMVAGIAHEINNPVSFIHGNLLHISTYLQTILGLVELCQERYGANDAEMQALIAEVELDFVVEDLRKILTSMRVGTQRIQEIVLSLRNFSRLDQAEVKAVDIHEGIDSTLMLLQHRLKPTVQRPEIQIIKQYGEIPKVECYPSQLNQVLMNLLANAIDALESSDLQPSAQAAKSHWIKITTQLVTDPDGALPGNSASPRLQIVIADNGLGMTEQVKAKIFDPFYTTKPVGQGTGLGLAISYQIIAERHGGTLKCRSELGQGTEFVIEIPVTPFSVISER